MIRELCTQTVAGRDFFVVKIHVLSLICARKDARQTCHMLESLARNTWRQTADDKVTSSLSTPNRSFRKDLLLSLLRWSEAMSCGTGPYMGPLSIYQMIHEWIWSSGGIILAGETEELWEEPLRHHSFHHKHKGFNWQLQCLAKNTGITSLFLRFDKLFLPEGQTYTTTLLAPLEGRVQLIRSTRLILHVVCTEEGNPIWAHVRKCGSAKWPLPSGLPTRTDWFGSSHDRSTDNLDYVFVFFLILHVTISEQGTQQHSTIYSV
jgi:hypothetical protein